MTISFKPYLGGGVVMDVPEMETLYKTREQYKKSKSVVDGDAYFNAIIGLLDWLIVYTQDVFQGKTYSDEHLIMKVFIADADIKNENIYKEYIRHCLYIAADYATCMKDNILCRDHLDRYDGLTYQMVYDIEWIVAHYEFYFKHTDEIHISHWSRPSLSPKQIMELANNLYYIEELPKVEDLDFRNMKPYMQFQLRQLLEILGKNLIGYKQIVDKDGRVVPKFTQVAWNFLDSYSKNGKWSVELPLPIRCVVRISKWANGFVHTTKINSCYLQFYALTMVSKLMTPLKGTEKVFYQDRPHWTFDCGDFKVENYYWLKKDFEHFIWNSGKSYVLWKPIEQVGAYLKSYGNPKTMFIMSLPPPVHGQSMVGQMIKDSKLINDNITAVYVRTPASSGMNDMGKMRWGKIRDYLVFLYEVVKKIKKERPQLVYVTPVATGIAFYRDYVVMLLLKMLKCNVVAHFHNKGVSTRQSKWLDNKLYQSYFKGIKVILLAECLYEDIKKYVKPNQVIICPNGIKDEHSGMIPKRTNTIPQMLFLSNLITSKGVVDLLDACKILKEKGVNFGCTYVGAESNEIDATMFNDMVKDRNLQDSVQYIGKQYGRDKEACYANSDIFVFPTFYHNECFPLVLLEAMSYGLPCVSTKEGAISEIIDDGATGYIVEKNNPQMLAEKLEVLIKDSTLRQEMGCAGKKKLEENFTLDIFEHSIFNALHFAG